MRILFDQCISHRILPLLTEFFPGASHTRNEGLTNADDYRVFIYAREKKFAAIVTLDHDYFSLLAIHKIPPQVIWLRAGNCSTRSLAELIIKNNEAIISFLKNSEQDCLQIYDDSYP